MDPRELAEIEQELREAREFFAERGYWLMVWYIDDTLRLIERMKEGRSNGS
ncbi:hypothetical protein [Pyrodictium abyssi]|uniref:Uncharacterized protein n=1 Tax=Pyrodictium abyssi TaxID=54256 RepID=A0ABM8IV17_9CREN|nr:hypothetical protein PABY_02140 [Pyrodictium abyssi]